ncbi:hypothetical protein CF327_g1600 [Tilletia walkeri]|nr:hypothetical protein CF327_g1600 [Tilletia walkeri]
MLRPGSRAKRRSQSEGTIIQATQAELWHSHGGWLAIGSQQEWTAHPAIRLISDEQATQSTDPTDSETVASNAVGQQGKATRPGHEAIPSSADNRQEQPSLERFLAGLSSSLEDGPSLAQRDTLWWVKGKAACWLEKELYRSTAGPAAVYGAIDGARTGKDPKSTLYLIQGSRDG